MQRGVRKSAASVDAERERGLACQALLEALPEAYLVVDAAGVVQEWSPHAAELFGWSAAEVVGIDAAALRLPAIARERGLPCFIQRDEQAARGGRRAMASGRDGRRFPVEIDVLERQVAGQTRFLCMVRDLSQRQIADQRLVQAEKMEAIGQLTGGLAHDFNNILGIFSGCLDALKSRLRDPECTELLELAGQAADRGREVAASLQALARRQPLVPQVVDINLAIRQLAPLLERSGGGNIQLAIGAEADRALVRIDVGAFNNVLLNCVINARDAMPDGGDILVYTQRVRIGVEDSIETIDLKPGPYLVVGVDDSGAGMAPDVLRRAVEPFFTTKPRGKGSGLGLAMAYTFARQCGGALRIRSTPGRGTSIHLFIPRLAADGSQQTTSQKGSSND